MQIVDRRSTPTERTIAFARNGASRFAARTLRHCVSPMIIRNKDRRAGAATRNPPRRNGAVSLRYTQPYSIRTVRTEDHTWLDSQPSTPRGRLGILPVFLVVALKLCVCVCVCTLTVRYCLVDLHINNSVTLVRCVGRRDD